MSRSDDLRKNAENCVALAEIADSDPKKKRYARMATAWSSLADTQAWLDGETERKAAGNHQSA
jgi:heme-degrading monooxygenase HmoA